jgi:hypothetical protein
MPLLPNKHPTTATVITGELAQNGNWVVACVDPQIPWPTSTQKIIYRGHTIFVLPQFDDYYPSLVVRLGAGLNNFEQAQILILNLLSVLCWVDDQGALVDQWGGGNLPRPMAGFSKSGIRLLLTPHFSHYYLPDVQDQRARWALAFYREGSAMRQVAYAFLSFYKIINILHRSGNAQKAWINTNIATATAQHRSHASQRLQQLVASGADAGQYLYESGRCAIAHAGQGPTVDPENPADLRRLHEDLPLVKALAAYAIEYEFGIKSAGTIFHEHLYELEGFRALFGHELCGKLKNLSVVQSAEIPPIPVLHVGLQREPEFPPLTQLTPSVAAVENGVVYLDCVSDGGGTRMLLALDFPNERLLTNTIDGLISLDDGSLSAIQNAVSVMTFKRKYFANGELVIRRADDGALIGRCDAFLPTNVDMGGTLRNFDAIIAHLKQLEEQRANPGA